MADPLIEMVVESVRVHMLSSQHVVILKETERDRYLPIWIGPWEANAIAMKLQGLAPERPLTHDLFSSTLDELGVAVRRVVISDLAEDTFHARLFLSAGERTVEIDSRPSDALALAVRAGARIFAEPAVLERAGVSPEPDEGDDERRDAEGSLLERPPSRTAAERAADPRLDIFRDFVNSLGSDQESEGTGSE
jgi:bifunctional DNase/RNase